MVVDSGGRATGTQAQYRVYAKEINNGLGALLSLYPEEMKKAHLSCVMLTLGCRVRPRKMNCGPHHASAPVTKATHVNANVDSMNDGLEEIIPNFYFSL
ncbi:jg16615 [Pararge aegeria aegeria]|uniref:Jg16615 protein n=1 Tax=Pararge aegeria aegeria TaxID=348720 RepID=A0A8S4R7V8_9NEOP|nr:jg16615 [Pararge aegeria aegeria]